MLEGIPISELTDLMIGTTSPRALPGLRLKEIVEDGNSPECATDREVFLLSSE
jgi:hypothetical protein